jgi:cytochrome c oxidase assembly protein subunit 15
MNDQTETPVCPRWLHVLAVLTVLFTLPLLFLGASVTTYGVGMVDPRGFRPPWEIVNGLIENTGFDWRLEYGHRTFGFLVGMCGIALAVGCFFCDRRGWMGWLAVAALAMICVQGILGILRVDQHAEYGQTYKLIHGIFAQVVFATLVSLALFTSRRWTADSSMPASLAVQRWSLVTVVLVFIQLLLGGLVRHREDLLGPRGHLLGAFVVTGAIIWLLLLIRNVESRERFRAQRILLMGFLAVQLLLGVESWLARFHVEGANLPQLDPLPMHAEWIRTAHYLVGTMIFSTTVAVALIAHRKVVTVSEPIPVRSRELEGAL